MTAISNITETLASVDVSNAIGKNSVGTEEKITTSFMNLMSGYNPQNNNNPVADSKAVSLKDSSDKVNNKSFEETKTFSSVNNDKVSTNGSSEMHEISDEDKKVFAAFEEDVKQVIKEKLNVTDEEIEEGMAELGLSFADLMNPQNIAELVMTLNDVEDVSELLTIDGFGELKQAIIDLTNNLNSELEIGQDELTKLVSSMDIEVPASTDSEVLMQDAFSVNPEEAVADGNTTQILDETVVSQPDTNFASQENTETVVLQKELESKTAEVTTNSDDAATKVSSEANPNAADTKVTVERKNVEETQVTEEEASDENQIKADTVNVSEAKEDTSDSEENNERQSSFDRRSDNVFARNTHERSNTGNDIAFNIEGRLATENTVSRAENVTPAYVDTENIISQIVTQARVINTQNVSTIEMQLNPENLGKMILHVAQEDGHITAKITAQNEVVKEALQTQLADLRVSLNQQGIKVDAVEITVSSHAFEENLEGQFAKENGEESANDSNTSARRTLNVNDIDEDNLDLAEEEQLAVNIMRDNGNQLDMHA